jgi:hypothetical protein
MDGQRFDDLARLIGSGASRRRVLTVLTGGLGSLWLGKGAARAQCANPETCQTDGDCCDRFTCDAESSACVAPPSCHPTGEACAADAECCVGSCLGGMCAACSRPGAACTDEVGCCGSAGCVDGICVGCGPLERPCPDYDHCCLGECLWQELCVGCLDQRDQCYEDANCCNGGSCFQGRCAICSGINAPCTASSECCSGLCLETDVDGFRCVGECRGAGVACVENQSCCSGLCEFSVCTSPACVSHDDCGFDGRCVNEVCIPLGSIGPGGYLCEDDSFCQPGLICELDRSGYGTCLEPCIPIHQACPSPGLECCNGRVCTNGQCEELTCVQESDACSADPDCCAGLNCVDGACQGGGSDDPPGDPAPTPEPSAGDVTTLPNTGVGGHEGGPDPLLGITLAAGAASWLLRRKIRETPAPAPDDE